MEQPILPLPCLITLTNLPRVALEERQALPETPGIYFVLEGETVRYIGRSVNLNMRWKGHHRLQEYRNKGLAIAWLTLSNHALLDPVEQACIEYFAPSDNGTTITTRIGLIRQYVLHIPISLSDKLKVIARQQRRSLQQTLIYAIEVYAAAHTQEKDAEL